MIKYCKKRYIMNRILKILILIVYTFAIFALAFFIVSITDKGANFKDYKENYKDENIAVVTQIIEKRQNKKQTKTDFEKSSYDIYFFVKKISSIEIKNLYVYVDGDYKAVDEYIVDSNVTKLDATGITIVAEIPVKPEVKLGKYKGVKVKKVEYAVTDEDVDAEINNMKEKEMVNHPQHYAVNGIECIDAMLQLYGKDVTKVNLNMIDVMTTNFENEAELLRFLERKNKISKLGSSRFFNFFN